MATKAEIREALTQAFKAFDCDNSGCINASELKSVLTKFYNSTGKPCDQASMNKSVDEFLSYADKNSDGKVTQQEFVDFFENLIN